MRSADQTVRPRGFTIVEIMIVVIIIGLLAVIAIPNLLKARNNAQAKACISNLRTIDSAKQMWAADTKAATNSSPTAANLAPYFQRGVMPVCPANGSYFILPINFLPICTLFATGHSMSQSAAILVQQ